MSGSNGRAGEHVTSLLAIAQVGSVEHDVPIGQNSSFRFMTTESPTIIGDTVAPYEKNRQTSSLLCVPQL